MTGAAVLGVLAWLALGLAAALAVGPVLRRTAARYPPAGPAAAGPTSEAPVPIGVVRRAMRRLHTLNRILDTLEPHMTMPADRQLIETILASLGPIADAVAAKDTRIRDLEQQLIAADVAIADDEAADAAALAPVAEAVAALRDALGDTVDAEPEPVAVADVPAAVEQATATGDRTSPEDPPSTGGADQNTDRPGF